MNAIDHIKKPSKAEQVIAKDSFERIMGMLKDIKHNHPEIEIEETGEKIKIPLFALRILAKVLEVTGQGNPISIVPIAAEMTTQAAAEFLSCSRPHLIKLLEAGEIPFTKVGKHRRIKFEDVRDYKIRMKQKQKELLIKMMGADEDLGLYDT
jgi:excisionase family DNA binding protein